MKDVLAVLKSRGEQAPSSVPNISEKSSGDDGKTWCVPGVGTPPLLVLWPLWVSLMLLVLMLVMVFVVVWR